MMRKLRILLPVFLLLCCILLCGCDLRNYIYTEDGLKKVAEKSLKKKYGEEFIIHSAWDRDQTRFYADCSPKDNPKVVFLACIYKNGEGVYGDEYPEEVVALEVDEILWDEFEEVFGDCYVKSNVHKFYTRPEFESPQTLTLEEYLEATGTRIGCTVFVRNADISEKAVKKEYQYLSETLQKRVNEEGIGENQFCGISIHFVEEEMVKKSEEFFLTHTYIKGEFDSDLRRYAAFTGHYEDGTLEQSYEEYLWARLYEQEELDDNRARVAEGGK